MPTNLYTNTPARTDSSTRVPTTEWVHSILHYSSPPRVGQHGLLSISVSKGRIRKGDCYDPTDDYYFTDGYTAIGLVANTTEYVWFRYSDSQIVVTESIPEKELSSLIAIVTTNIERITSIQNFDGWDCPEAVTCTCLDQGGESGGTASIVSSLITISDTPPNTTYASDGQLWVTLKSSYRTLWIFKNNGWHVLSGSTILNYGPPYDEGDYPGQLHYNIASGIMSIYIESEWRSLIGG